MIPFNCWTREERQIVFSALDWCRHIFGAVGLLMWFWNLWIFAGMISISVISSMFEHYLRIKYKDKPLGECPSIDCKCN